MAAAPTETDAPSPPHCPGAHLFATAAGAAMKPVPVASKACASLALLAITFRVVFTELMRRVPGLRGAGAAAT